MNNNFRDWAFDKLTKPLPARERYLLLPDGKVKRFLQNVDYAIDRVFIYFFLFVILPGAFLVGLYATWQTIQQIFQ